MQTIIRKIRKKLFRKKSGSIAEIFTGGSIAFIYRIATMAVSYGLMIFISRKFGDEGMGVYNLSLALMGILVLFGCAGLDTSVVRFVSQYNSKGDVKAVASFYKIMMKISVPMAVLLSVALFALAPYIAIELYKDAMLVLPFKIVAVILPMVILFTINVEFLRGLKKIHISEYFRNLNQQLINLIGLAIASFFIVHYYDPLVYFGLGGFISLLFTFYFVRKWFRASANAGASGASTSAAINLRSVLWVSAPMAITSFTQLLNGKIDTLMLGVYRDIGLVGIFGVAFKLSVITNFVIGALKTITMPKISELFWQNDMNELDKVIQYTNRVVFVFSLVVCVVLLLFPEFILALVNPEFTLGATTLRIFAITQLLNAGSGMVAAFLNMTGNQTFFTKLIIAATALNFILNMLLIPKYGMEGAALGTLVSVIGWNITGVIYIKRKYNINTFYNPFRDLKKLLS